MSFEQELADEQELIDDREYYNSFLLDRQVDVIMGDVLITYEITNPVDLLINLDITQEELCSLHKVEIIKLIEEKLAEGKVNVEGSQLKNIQLSKPVDKQTKDLLAGLGIPVEIEKL